MAKEVILHKTISTVLGPLTLVSTELALISLTFGSSPISEGSQEGDSELLKKAENQLHEYFSGQRKVFDLPLEPQGTQFQLTVWNELKKIPYGQTISYQEQAQNIQKPKASRAVGAANGKNPLAILIPCHRVISSSGKLTGFSGGLETKKKLLELEFKTGAEPQYKRKARYLQ